MSYSQVIPKSPESLEQAKKDLAKEKIRLQKKLYTKDECRMLHARFMKVWIQFWRNLEEDAEDYAHYMDPDHINYVYHDGAVESLKQFTLKGFETVDKDLEFEEREFINNHPYKIIKDKYGYSSNCFFPRGNSAFDKSYGGLEEMPDGKGWVSRGSLAGTHWY